MQNLFGYLSLTNRHVFNKIVAKLLLLKTNKDKMYHMFLLKLVFSNTLNVFVVNDVKNMLKIQLQKLSSKRKLL